MRRPARLVAACSSRLPAAGRPPASASQTRTKTQAKASASSWVTVRRSSGASGQPRGNPTPGNSRKRGLGRDAGNGITQANRRTAADSRKALSALIIGRSLVRVQAGPFANRLQARAFLPLLAAIRGHILRSVMSERSSAYLRDARPLRTGNPCCSTAGVSAHGRSLAPMITAKPLLLRRLAPKPAAVEALDVGEEVVDHWVAGLQRLDVELARAGGAVVLAYLLELRVRSGHLWVDLEQCVLGLAHVDDCVQLPIAVVRAEVVPAVAAVDELPVGFPADDVQALARRQHDRVLVGDPILEHGDPLLEPV